MFQYAKKFVRDKIKRKKELQEKAKQEKNNIERKLNMINEYDSKKKEIRDAKLGSGGIICVMILISGLLQLAGITLEAIVLAIICDIAVAIILLPNQSRKLKKLKKEYKKFSPKEIKELKENEESMKELYKKLEKEITDSQRSIDQYEEELGKISVVEEFKDSNSMNQPFYQADTVKEYYELINKQGKSEMTLEEFLNEKGKYEAAEMAFDEFLNEKVNYEDVHLEVRAVDTDKKPLIKRY